MEATEMLTEIEVPAKPKNTGFSFKQVCAPGRRICSCGCCYHAYIEILPAKLKDGRISFMGVSEKPVPAEEALKLLKGNKPTDELIRDAIEATVVNELDPGPDIHASAEYRSHMARCPW